MVPTVSSQRNRRAEPRWQDKMVAGFWLPFSLLFDLWVYFTPTYAEKWSLPELSQSRAPSRRSLRYPFLMAAFMVTSVLGFALLVLRTLPPLTSRLLLVVAFGFSLRQFLRPKI
jgi:hypothetical protein